MYVITADGDGRANDEDDAVADARAEEEEAVGDTRVNATSFYTWGTDSWDLLVEPLVDEEVESVTPLADLQSHDKGLSEEFEAMRTGVGGKRTKLMCEMRGVTRLNFGLDAFIADALGPYQMLVTRLQTSEQSVAHLVKEWVLLFFDEMNEMFLSESANFGRHYQAWKDRGDDTADEIQLRRGIERLGQKFVHVFIANVRFRFQPYWPLLMACEVANPCSPK